MYLLFDIMTSMLLLCNTQKKKTPPIFVKKIYSSSLRELNSIFMHVHSLVLGMSFFFFYFEPFGILATNLISRYISLFYFWGPLTIVLEASDWAWSSFVLWVFNILLSPQMMFWVSTNPECRSVTSCDISFSTTLSKFWVIAWILIGPSHCLLLLWLITVINLVLVFQQSFENRWKAVLL